MLSVSHKLIKEPLSVITSLSVPSSKSPLSTFQSTGISVRDGKLMFRCDGQAGFGEVEIDVPDCKDEIPLTYVNTQKLTASISAIGESLNIKQSKNGIELSNATTSIEIRSIDCASDRVSGEGITEWLPIDGKGVAKAIQRTFGVFEDALAVTLDNRGIVWCATSGNTMVSWTHSLTIPTTAKVPKESCRILVQALNAGECEIGEHENLYVVRFKADSYRGMLSIGKFHDVSKVARFSYEFTQRPRTLLASVSKKDLLSALNACAVVQTADNTRVRIYRDGPVLRLLKATTDYGGSKSEVLLEELVETAKIDEPHCSLRLAKAVGAISGEAEKIEIREIVIGEYDGVPETNLAFVSGNTIAVSMQLQLVTNAT